MLPELLLIVDVETTGLDPKKDHVIELGAILYSVSNACVLQQLSTLFPVTENFAEKINKISSQASLLVTKEDSSMTLSLFENWVSRADYVVAHNASFDKQWFGKGYLPNINKKWLCTYDDFVWVKNDRPTSLVNTVLNYGIGVSNAHRALTDCQLIAALFDRVAESPDDFQQILLEAIKRSEEPMYKIVGDVAYNEKDYAKQFGFKWDPKNKKWTKVIRLSDYKREKENYTFKFNLRDIIELP